MSSPEELDAAIKDKLAAGDTARLAKVQPKTDAASGSPRQSSERPAHPRSDQVVRRNMR
jgi:hypothetical protein